MPNLTASLMRTTTWLMLALGAVCAATLVPGVCPAPSYQAATDRGSAVAPA